MEDGLLGWIDNYLGTPCRDVVEVKWAELKRPKLRPQWSDTAKAMMVGAGGGTDACPAGVARPRVALDDGCMVVTSD